MRRTIPVEVAILISGLVIAAAIVFTNHWQMGPGVMSGTAVRMDRWTGNVRVCSVIPGQRPTLGRGYAGLKLSCE